MDGPDAAKLSPPGVWRPAIRSRPDAIRFLPAAIRSQPAAIRSCLLPSASCLFIRFQAFSYHSARRRSNCGLLFNWFIRIYNGWQGTNLTAHSDIFSSQGLTSAASLCRPPADRRPEPLSLQEADPRKGREHENIRLIHPFCQLGWSSLPRNFTE